MKKRQPSPFIAQMMEKFERSHEESTTAPINPRSAPKTQKSPLSQHPEKFVDGRAPLQQTSHVSDKEQSNTVTQESQTPSVKVAPPKPPRTKAKALNSQTIQESQTPSVNVPPQRPPRAKERELSNTATQESQTAHVKVPPQRPPRARDRELSNTATQESQTPSVKVAPPKPPRTKAKAPSSQTTQESGVVYAEVVIQTPQHTKDRQQSKTAAQEDKTIYATVVPQRASSLSKGEIIVRVRNNMFVQACKDEIEILSQTVYGKSDIFQKKLEEIEKNPILGESLSWQVAANPKFVAPLAGKKVLGVKSKARKQAEESISPLCLALENYAETVKQAKENILHGHRAKQTRHRESMDLRQMAESLQKPRKPEQERAPLSQKEIVRRVKSDTAVQYCYAEIIYWCTMAYGDPSILQHRLEEVQKSSDMGEQLAWQVTNYPRLFGKLVGCNIHGLKNNARKKAESALTRLGEAIEGYAEAVKHAKENIVQTHQENQRRHAPQPREWDKNLQQQQHLSKSPKPVERLAATVHQQASETSRQAEKQSVDVRPKKVAASKAMALTG